MMAPDSDKAWTELRVGLMSFTAMFFLVLGVTFAGGEKGILFRKTSLVKAKLSDIGGLKKGSMVTMGGMSIGKVIKVDFVEHAEAPIEVIMQIRSDFRPYIKTDSRPTVKTQGMLGDRYIEITVGTKESPILSETDNLVGNSSSDFDDTLRQAKAALSETTKMLEAINAQQGTIGQFLYDPQIYERLNTITKEVDELLKDFKANPRRYVKFSVF
jgi:phospholipid/cholesterol/gamma-HCH transport system substrate-binding protein